MNALRIAPFLLLLAAVLVGCGGGHESDGDGDADSDSDSDSDSDADGDGDGDGDTDADGDGDGDADGDADGDCAAATDALATRIDISSVIGCTVVVRFDHDSLAPLGYALVSGGPAGATEEIARAAAQAATGYGEGGAVLNPPSPEDAWVFYEAPGDFGGAAAVSAHTALAVFGGSIVWDGRGDITYPTEWDDAAELGEDCPVVGTLGSVRGYDLVDGTDLTQDEMDPVLAVLERTVAPAAIWQGGYVFSTVVLRYPRSVGAFDPSTAEWIVLLDGGWLE